MKKSIKFLSMVMALAMCVPAILVAHAEEIQAGQHQVNVSLATESTYTVKIPKTIVLNAATKDYTAEMEVSGNIAGTQQIVVDVPGTFQMGSPGKTTINANVNMYKANETAQTELAFSSDEAANSTEASVYVALPGATAGTWTGSFNFNIALETASPTLITFETYYSGTHQVESGMTWEEWVDSEYNDGYIITELNNSSLPFSNQWYIEDDSSNIIQADRVYREVSVVDGTQITIYPYEDDLDLPTLVITIPSTGDITWDTWLNSEDNINDWSGDMETGLNVSIKYQDAEYLFIGIVCESETISNTDVINPEYPYYYIPF